MAKRKIKHYHTRFSERLPVKGKTNIENIKSKYYHLVEKFIEEYFSMEEEISPKVVLDTTFALLVNGIDDFDLGNLEEFQKALSCSVLAYVYMKGGKLKVSEHFFVDQFVNAFAMRAYSFTLYADDASEFILSGLKSVGISQNESIDLLEGAMDSAEAIVEYSYSEKSYINSLVEELVKLAKSRDLLLTKQILLPPEFV